MSKESKKKKKSQDRRGEQHPNVRNSHAVKRIVTPLKANSVILDSNKRQQLNHRKGNECGEHGSDSGVRGHVRMDVSAGVGGEERSSANN